MELGRKSTVLLTLAIVAAAGYLLVTTLPTVLSEYEKARAFSQVWGYIYLAIIVAVAVAVVSLAVYVVWLLSSNSRAKRARRKQQSRSPSQMTPQEREQEIRQRLVESQTIADDASFPAESRQPIRAAVAELDEKLKSRTLEIVAFGAISSGKSTVLNALAGRDVFRTDPKGGTTLNRNEIPWPGDDKVVLVDTPGLAEIDGLQREQLARRAARDADLVLLVIDGALRDFEYRLVEQLAEMEKPLLICLNKEDWLAEGDRDLLRRQIEEQVQRLVQKGNVVAIRAQPAARTRVRVLPDGREVEEQVQAEPDIRALAERMMAIVRRDGQDILLANLLLRARGMASDARLRVQTSLDERAKQLVDRAMWQAAAVAALSPMPVVDVAAGLTISTKMVLDLARVYGQSIDFEMASRLMGELGKNLLSILGGTMATPLVGTAVASLLKSVPGAGTIAGGALQGLIQALMTRWIGSVFIVYFREEMKEPQLGWAALAREKWEQVTRPAELAQLVKTGISRLRSPKP